MKSSSFTISIATWATSPPAMPICTTTISSMSNGANGRAVIDTCFDLSFRALTLMVDVRKEEKMAPACQQQIPSRVARSAGSARLLAVAFLGVALIFVCQAWLRPPLSGDIRAFSFSLLPDMQTVQDDSLRLKSGNFRLDSPGALLVALTTFL